MNRAHRFQFSLRGYLWLSVCCAFLMSVFAAHQHPDYEPSIRKIAKESQPIPIESVFGEYKDRYTFYELFPDLTYACIVSGSGLSPRTVEVGKWSFRNNMVEFHSGNTPEPWSKWAMASRLEDCIVLTLDSQASWYFECGPSIWSCHVKVDDWAKMESFFKRQMDQMQSAVAAK